MSDSLITKKAIATGLKELTKQKSFDKITVSDITKICGLNRQTFYYHFQDKFELADWIYYNEAISIIVNDMDNDNWEEKVLQFLKKLKEEDYFYISTLKASVENEFREYLFKIIVKLLCDIFSEIAIPARDREDDVRIIAEFYAHGFIGGIVSWAHNGMKETPECLAERLKMLLIGTQKYIPVFTKNV